MFPILKKLLATVIVKFSHLSTVQILATEAQKIVVLVQLTTDKDRAAASM